MNKLFSKIAGLSIGLAMAIGVGVAVGSSGKEARPVYAAGSYSLTFDSSTSSSASGGGTVCTSDWSTALTTAQFNTSGTASSTISKVKYYYHCYGYGNIASVQTCTNIYPGKNSFLKVGKAAGDGVLAFTISGTDITISSVVINAYATANTVKLTVSEANESTKEQTVDVTTEATAKNFTFTYPTSNTAVKTVSITGGQGKTSSNKIPYIKSITINYATASIPTTSVDVSPASVTLAPGGTQQLTTTVLPANTTDALTYSSSATGVATVTSSGLITAVADGTATITATSGNYSDTCIVTVETPTTPFITPAKSSTSGYTGQDETISVTYGNLTTGLAVSSNNTSVVDASIDYDDESGNADILLEFNGAGSTTVSLKDGSTQLTTISVSVTASSVTITGLASTGSVYVGKTTDLSTGVTVTAVGSYSNAVTWASDATGIATVSNAGVVTGVSEGTAHISVTSVDYPSATMSCTVTVSEKPLQYVMTFGATKNTNPTEIKTNDTYHSTYSSVDNDVVASDFSKIYGVSSSQLKCGSGSASATISFTIPDSSYITSVVVVVATAGGTSMNVTSGATSAETENQTIAVGTLTFDDYLSSEKSNKVTLSSSASGAFYLTSITINYANFAPELHASSTSVEAAVNTSNQSINLTYDYFTPTSYTATVKSGTSLTAGAVAFSTSSTPHTATFTTGSSTGATVFTITGTGGGKSASVDVTVTVTEVRNLLTLTITTPSDATSFKVGQSFDVGSLEITATFDAAPTTVVYSKTNDNLGALTFAPAIGYTFVDADIGTVTSVIAELELGTGDEYVEYTIAVTDKSYAAQVTDVADLWDGQQIYFGASDGSRVNVVHAGGNQLTSQEANVHETKGLCLDDLEHSAAYTVHREKIDDVIYYSFQNGGYYLEASNTSNNYLTRTDTLSDNCRYTISISSGEVTMTNKGNSSRPEFRWNSGSSWFSQYQSSSSLDKAVIYVITSYSEEAVADAFVERYLHMEEEVSGQCNTYYPILKPVWAAMAGLEKAGVSGAAYERLQAWAAAHGEILDSDMNLVSASRISILGTTIQNGSTVTIIVIISMISVAAIGGYFLFRRRKEQ